MLSQEVQDVMKRLRGDKEAAKGKTMTPDIALKVRSNVDGILGGLHYGEGISVEVIDKDGVKGEFYRFKDDHPGKQKGKVLLYIHGGGFMTGSVTSRRKDCHNIIEKAKIDAFSVEYGQWPESKHPQGMNDCLAAYRWLISLGYKPENIYIYGGSAGAMLTLVTILYLKDHNEPLPGKACVFSPVAGQNMDLPSHTELDDRDPMITFEPIIPYYEGSDFKSPYVSPGYGDYKGFPKLQIHVGSEEVLLDDSKLIYRLCKDAGVDVNLRIWDGLFHVFTLFDVPESRKAHAEIAEFLGSE